MKQTDCGVFPARAEGWNLELLEMMCCGKHVITTNYSAHKEFCNNDNAHLVNITRNEPAYDGIWFHGKNGNWANIGPSQVDEIVHYMRKIHDLKQSGLLAKNISGINTANKFSWNNTANTVLKYV